MDAFSSLLSQLPEKDAALIQGLQEYRQGQMSALRQQREAQVVESYKAKNAALKAVQDQYNQIPDEIKQKDFPAIKHDMNAAANRIEFNHQMGLIDPNDPSKEFKLSILKEQFPEKDRVNFIDTPQYKSAEADWTRNRERYDITNALGDQLIQMRSLLNEGTPEAKRKATDVAKEGIMKTVNSLQGKDAVSLGEQLTRYLPLLSIPDVAAQTGKGMFDLNLWVQKLKQAQGERDEKRQESLMSQMNDLMGKAFETYPEQFYDTTAKLYNSAADTSNNNAKRAENMTSPYHRQLMQANYIKSMAEKEAEVFGQPYSAQSVTNQRTAQPVSNNAPQPTAPPAAAQPTASPAAQSAAPNVDPALIEAFRKRGLTFPQ